MKLLICLFGLALLLIFCSCNPLSTPTITTRPIFTPTKAISIPSFTPTEAIVVPSFTATNIPSTPTKHTPTLGESFSKWLSAPYTGVASAPFIISINEGNGTRGLVINDAETKAYIVGEFLGQMHQIENNNLGA